MATVKSYEDLKIGNLFVSRSVKITELEIKMFANLFLVSSLKGIEYEAPVVMLIPLLDGLSGEATESLRTNESTGNVSLSWDHYNYYRPVRPGDFVHALTEVVALRKSNSRKGMWVVTYRKSLINQYGVKILQADHTQLEGNP